ncbi:Arc family DNA-binding protein [Parasphingorhabdus sp.]|uniref:Arc family DNA-binding protein n=1 Tax=Parasphingorhabdus sp. TaxID=2709688 RepID=UPI003A904F52
MTKKQAGPKGSGLDYTFAKLRMPTKLKALLTDKAKSNGNTLNAEILERLQSSIDAETGLGGPQMIALWSDLKKEIDYAEQATGKQWQADTATFAAAKALLEAQLLRFRPPMENQKEVFAAGDELDRREASLNARLEILERCGVIKKYEWQNAFATLAENSRSHGGIFGAARARTNKSRGKVYEGEAEKFLSDEIRQCGYVLAVDLEQDPEAWDITDEDGSEAAPAHGAAMSALLASIPKARNHVTEARIVFSDSFAKQQEAEALGKALAKNKLQGPIVTDRPDIEDL